MADLGGIAAQRAADGFQLLHLAAEHGAGELVHAEVRGGEGGQQSAIELFLVGRFRRAAHVVEPQRPFEQRRVVAGDRAALARGDGFAQLEAVDAHVADAADILALVASAAALGAVFQQEDFMFARDGEQCVQIGGAALQVAGDDRLGARRDAVLDVCRVDGQRVVDFGEHRQGPGMDDAVVVGVPGPGGHDHFVAGADFHRGHGGDQSRTAGGDAQSVLHSDELGVASLEL